MLDSIATPTLWWVTIGAVVGLLVIDFIATRKPHEVSMREAIAWSVFYVALPLLFGLYVWNAHGSDRGLEYYTGYLVEKTLSVDNLFVFMLLLAAFAVPKALQQRVLLYGIVGALVLRGIFIALGAAALDRFDWVFLVFGLVLLLTGLKLLRDAVSGHDHEMDVNEMRIVRLTRRVMPVTDDYEGTRLVVRREGRRWLTPFALVVIAVFATDVVFAVDSVPAVYGITGDPYLVFATNAFALLGLRALYFVLQGALAKLVHLSYGLAAILGFIGVKLVLHWAHEVWSWVPSVPTLASLGVILAILAITTTTSLIASRRADDEASGSEDPDPEHPGAEKTSV
ncbi:TerC/Alx family metal homeostasis membrane protein [Nocardioides sp. Soil805]|uniref:TerC/Alx family metal homeostasis membrane protein n=1 Tax=Nocardioides sp. Soil805 TaxID=1736416 RepID=UPI000ABCDE41|nr:TerC/Alx family metal homeostasis membrane protein [Nocardioides sp. Soil805]